MTLHLWRIGGAMTAQVGAFFLLCILMGGLGSERMENLCKPGLTSDCGTFAQFLSCATVTKP